MRHVAWIFLYCVISVIVGCECRCDSELGMKTKTIPEESITASSQKSDRHSPSFARVDGKRAWCSKPDDKSPYIQIELDEPKLITAITTQGSRSDLSWSRKYRVKYLERGSWKSYKGEFKGNRNSGALWRNKLTPAIRTQSIRIYPKEPYSVMLDTTEPIPCCLRLELHGCSALVDCGVLPTPNKGNKIMETNTTVGGVVRFQCKEKGYELSGSEIRTCQNNGLWSGSTTSCKRLKRNCAELYKSGQRISGVYTIDPDGSGAFDVFCDQTTAGGGWTVFQKRLNGSVDFYRGWADYKNGFGNLNSEFWLGLDKVNRLTKTTKNRLRVDLEETTGKTAYAEYDMFAVTSERTKYQLSIGTYSGTAGDSLSGHRGYSFTTKDQDNDIWSSNCAVRYKGAWWYGICHSANLNGFYYHGKHSSYADGVNWYDWKGYYYSAKRAEMKIRPVKF